MRAISCEVCCERADLRRNKCASCTACGSLFCLIVCLPVAIMSGQTTYRSIGCLFGWGIASSINTAEVSSSSWAALDRMYHGRFWLGQSALVVGFKDAPPDKWYVSSRGNLFTPDLKMAVASASKWVSATVIYAVIEDPATSLHVDSLPADILPWWRCDDPASDRRCSPSLTLTKLLAFRGGLPRPGCENGRPGGEAWEACAKSMFGLGSTRWLAASFDVFSYDSTGLFLAGLMALQARRAVPGHATDQWADLLREYVTVPAQIEHARVAPPNNGPAAPYAVDGSFAYDDAGRRAANPAFPGLSGSLGCSALQVRVKRPCLAPCSCPVRALPAPCPRPARALPEPSCAYHVCILCVSCASRVRLVCVSRASRVRSTPTSQPPSSLRSWSHLRASHG